MAGSVNKVILVGNLGRDPEVRSTQDGLKIVNLSLATSESWRDKNSGERRERTEWHRVVIFNEKLGEVAEKFLKKGSKIYVEGALQTRKWTDQGGQERYSTEVVLQRFRGELTMLDGKGGGGPGGGGGGDMGEGFSEPASGGRSGGGRGSRRRYSVLEPRIVRADRAVSHLPHSTPLLCWPEQERSRRASGLKWARSRTRTRSLPCWRDGRRARASRPDRLRAPSPRRSRRISRSDSFPAPG